MSKESKITASHIDAHQKLNSAEEDFINQKHIDGPVLWMVINTYFESSSSLPNGYMKISRNGDYVLVQPYGLWFPKTVLVTTQYCSVPNLQLSEIFPEPLAVFPHGPTNFLVQVDYFENLPSWNRQYFGLNTGCTFSVHAFTCFSCNASSKTYINGFKEFPANFSSDIVSNYKIYITSTEEKQ